MTLEFSFADDWKPAKVEDWSDPHLEELAAYLGSLDWDGLNAVERHLVEWLGSAVMTAAQRREVQIKTAAADLDGWLRRVQGGE